MEAVQAVHPPYSYFSITVSTKIKILVPVQGWWGKGKEEWAPVNCLYSYRIYLQHKHP